jgi:SNF2 family DNA or RNA helicase
MTETLRYPYRRQPRPYQRDGSKSVYKRRRFFLAFEMGTGKTQIALDFLGVLFFFHKLESALVVAPLGALGVWEAEIEALWPKELQASYCLLRPDTDKHTWQSSNLVITNFDMLRLRVHDLMKWAPDAVIIDESHRIKNPYAKQSKAAHRLGNVCRFAVCLTGTPIGNRPLDLWSQFKFLVPGLLEPKFKDFKDHYSIWGGGGGHELRKYKNLPELAKIIHPYVKSMKKKDFLDLPDKNFIEVPVEMGEKARKMYASMERDFIAYVEQESIINAPIALAKLTKLSQISGGFIRDTENEKDHAVHAAKLEVLEGICDDLREQEVKRVVVFARFLWEIAEIKKRLAPNWVTFEISGSVDSTQRTLAQKMFNASGGAMICQISSGSVAINLQASNYMIFYSLDYSHINFSQAQDRIHRMGQDKPCYYYMLLSKATIDRHIYRVLRQKKSVADNMMKMVKEMQKEKV